MSRKRPNIVWIMADDLGYGDLGCYGQRIMRTPHLDGMAREGIRFTDCYAGAHMCAPSRATFLTGKHEGHSTVREIWFRNGERAHLRAHETTVAQVLKRAGYATALFGKHHAIGAGMTGHFGFDTYFHVNEAHPALGAHYPLSVESHEGVSEVRANAGIGAGIEQSGGPVNRELAFDYIEKHQDWVDGTYMDDLSTDAACDFIGENRGKPFFLYLAFHAPHTKYVSPSIGRYMHKDWDPLSKGYVPMVERMDSHVGAVLDAIGNNGLDEDTIVFFTSDNGGVCRDGQEGVDREAWTAFRKRILMNRDLRKGKHYHFEGGIRVPMIVRAPGRIAPGTVSNTPCYFADALPTLAEIGRASDGVPDDVDGASIVPTLLGREQPELNNRPLYWEAHKFFGFYQVVRKGDWKLIRWTQPGPRLHPLGDADPILSEDRYPMLELYNVVRDHREEHNLADKETRRLNELLRLIDSVLRVMDKPDYDKDLFPCQEFDAFYDLAIAWTSAPGYRAEDIRKLAAHRIHYILESHRQADRGLSSYLDRCIPTWLDWDMAPAVAQGDAFGWGIYSAGINICVDILGIADRVPWTGTWRHRDRYDTSAFVEVGRELQERQNPRSGA